MPDALSIECYSDGAVTTVGISGSLDAHTAPQLEALLESEIGAGRVKIVADASRLDFISSAGMGVFLGFIDEVRDRGGDIKICGLSTEIRQVFDLLGFEPLFDLTTTVDEARQRFDSSST